MDKQKVLIIDDERSARTLIREYIAAYDHFEIIGEATNGFEAVQLINEHKPDVVFLDIQMPGYNGFEVIERLEEIPEIIFSTAYDTYALDAFEVHAVDYLLKPYTRDRFSKALSKLNANHSKHNLMPFAEALLLKKEKYATRILATKQRKLIPINTADIIWMEAYGDYAKLHTSDISYTSNYGLSTLLEKVDPDVFLRVHRSYAINFRHVSEIRREEKGLSVQMSNGKIVPISRRQARNLKHLRF